MTFKPLAHGIIQVTGSADVGKTTFALESGAHPERILFVDDDSKGRATIEQMLASGINPGRYIDFAAETRGLKLFETFEYGRALIDSIEPGQYDAIIFDTWTRFGSSFKSYVTARPGEFRAANDWSSMGRIKGPQQYKEAQRLEGQLLGELAAKAPLVFLTAHLKDFYANNVNTGKSVPDSSRTIARICSMRLWLMHNPNGSPVPIALVLKRPSNKVFIEGKGLRTVNLLPRKLVPNGSEASLWDTIARYIAEPIGLRDPRPEECPTEFELSILDGTLTKEQQRTLQLSLAAIASMEPTEAETDALERADLTQRVKELKSKGLKTKAIAEQLGIAPREVKGLLE